jgi:hypothetical protein
MEITSFCLIYLNISELCGLSSKLLNANLLRVGRGGLTYGFYGGFINKKYRFAEFLSTTYFNA